MSFKGCYCSNSLNIYCDGLIKLSLAANDTSNGVLPPIACLVNSATYSPTPAKSASLSIPSSAMTVESTSKHTQSAFFHNDYGVIIVENLNSYFDGLALVKNLFILIN